MSIKHIRLHILLLCSMTASPSISQAQSHRQALPDPGLRDFCNTTAESIQKESAYAASNSSAGGASVNAIVKMVPIGGSVNHQSSQSFNSMSRYESQYRSMNCDEVLRQWGQIQVADITANALIRVATIQGRTEIRKTEIEGNTAIGVASINNSGRVHESDNILEAVKIGNKTDLMTTGISAGVGLLGTLIGGSRENKERELALQLQREKQAHELKVMQMQQPTAAVTQQQAYYSQPVYQQPQTAYPQPLPVYQQPQAVYPQAQPVYQQPQAPNPQAQPIYQQPQVPYPQAQPIYQQPVIQPIPVGNQPYTNASSVQPYTISSAGQLSQPEMEMQQRFGLMPDRACNRGSLIIKLINAQTICALSSAMYPPGRYFYNGTTLVKAN